MNGLSWPLFLPDLARTLVLWHNYILLQMSSILPHYSPANGSSRLDYWIVFHGCSSGSSLHRRPSQSSSEPSQPVGPPNVALSASVQRWVCRSSSWNCHRQKRQIHDLTGCRGLEGFCNSRVAANVFGVRGHQRRPLMLYCILLEGNLEIGFTFCSFFPLLLIR